ncbi:hypothetical protein Aph02nite_47290 [Actinoplanes philippinensis]|uniref:Predicted outer membrane protein n=1 Tax=Actinoplanes philippinensis TaxID=35752 RepID=A0A1I2I002_9ACTN|nr:DUF4142 domain-containing protein [Actinoplanes philippinensis]GIE78779.1 hypothetical protein Aph02nite_47290 [Actinoplanes philippinensis]SFF35604.1 Predicted outer membrane protein [Actinoplanes philippinensis]
MLFRRIMVAVGAAASVAAGGAATLAATPAFAEPAAGPVASEAGGAPALTGAAALTPALGGPAAVAVGPAAAGAVSPAWEAAVAVGPVAAGAVSPARVVAGGSPGLAVDTLRTGIAEPSTQDTAFLQAANEINLAGIAQGRIAWTRTTNAEVKEIAGRFMVDHIRLNAEITEAARKLKLKLNATPNAEQIAVAERYQAASAGSFDLLYLSTQLELQQEAKRIADAQVARGSDASIKQVAAEAAPILAGHQKMLRDATS